MAGTHSTSSLLHKPPISLSMLKLSSMLIIPKLLFCFPTPPNQNSPQKPQLFFVSPFFSLSKIITKIIAEYAKSGRSSCKKCGKAITSQALRLGLVTRDARGFDTTKWHHLDCFPEKFDSLDVIKGFDSLKNVDQEALKKLADGYIKSPKQLQGKEDEEERKQQEEEIELEKSDLKKIKDATLEPKWKAFRTIIFLERAQMLGLYSLMYPSIPEKLQSLYEEGYKLVIFMNESNIDRWKNKRQVAVDSKIRSLNILSSK